MQEQKGIEWSTPRLTMSHEHRSFLWQQLKRETQEDILLSYLRQCPYECPAYMVVYAQSLDV